MQSLLAAVTLKGKMWRAYLSRCGTENHIFNKSIANLEVAMDHAHALMQIPLACSRKEDITWHHWNRPFVGTNAPERKIFK